MSTALHASRGGVLVSLVFLRLGPSKMDFGFLLVSLENHPANGSPEKKSNHSLCVPERGNPQVHSQTLDNSFSKTSK